MKVFKDPLTRFKKTKRTYHQHTAGSKRPIVPKDHIDHQYRTPPLPRLVVGNIDAVELASVIKIVPNNYLNKVSV